MNDIARHYDRLIDENQDPVHDAEPLKKYMDKWDGQSFIDKMQLDKTKSVLEIGVGTGRLAVKAAPICGFFTGIDISEKTVEKAKENLATIQHKNLLCGDFLTFDFKEKFDVVYSSLTFMHIKEKQKAFDKIFSLLKDEGLFVWSIDKNQDDIIDAGFSKITVYPDNPKDIIKYANLAGLKLLEQYETEFAHIFVFQR
ncbi:MAG: class I SAM-dependent DNA methyltransferase [Candidatus Fimenecus sp.]